MADTQFQHMLKGFSLTTAEILYHLPDYPALLQTFIWQDYDVAPKFPKLIGFLDFWSKNIDGKLASVRALTPKPAARPLPAHEPSPQSADDLAYAREVLPLLHGATFSIFVFYFLLLQ